MTKENAQTEIDGKAIALKAEELFSKNGHHGGDSIANHHGLCGDGAFSESAIFLSLLDYEVIGEFTEFHPDSIYADELAMYIASCEDSTQAAACEWILENISEDAAKKFWTDHDLVTDYGWDFPY